jgi:hypothetical protein
MPRIPNSAASQNGSAATPVSGKQAGVIPNFHHVLPSSPAALESYIHLYLEGMAKAGLDGAGGKRR